MSEPSLLRDTIVYLGAAVVCVPLASRLRLGSVLGYLGAGCLLGPFGLRLVSDPMATLHFAEIGVVLMLLLRITVMRSTSLIVDVEPKWIAISLVVGLIGGSIGALYPALRAARQDAVDALSYE